MRPPAVHPYPANACSTTPSHASSDMVVWSPLDAVTQARVKWSKGSTDASVLFLMIW